MQKLRAAVLGASGYTGADLVRLLARHPQVEIVLLTAERRAGESMADVFPNFAPLDLPDLIALSEVEWPALDVDVVFCALPHATTQNVIKGLCHDVHHSLLEELVAEGQDDLSAGAPEGIRVIDLSADFRLRDADVYAEWYGGTHDAVNLQKKAVYGLSEMNREAVKNALLVACPGCYPTATLLAVLPLVARKLLGLNSLIIDAKSGVSGAGRALKDSNLYCEVADCVVPYGLTRHRHMPEMEQEISLLAGRDVTVSFTPHLVPMSRGELVTINADLESGVSVEDVYEALEAKYADEPFVTLLPFGQAASTRMVKGSNYVAIGVAQDRLPGRVIITAAIDNLVKGSSGQAVQNMNIMFGLPETLGLEQLALFP